MESSGFACSFQGALHRQHGLLAQDWVDPTSSALLGSESLAQPWLGRWLPLGDDRDIGTALFSVEKRQLSAAQGTERGSRSHQASKLGGSGRFRSGSSLSGEGNLCVLNEGQWRDMSHKGLGKLGKKS